MKVGPKFTYDPVILPDLISSMQKAQGSFGQVADLNKIPRDTFYFWLKRGGEEHNQGLSTELVQLSSSLRKEQAEVIVALTHAAMNDDKKSKFIMWWFSRICREDFGLEGMEIKELRDIFKVLLPLINGNGAQVNGRKEEMDPSNAHEKGCVA